MVYHDEIPLNYLGSNPIVAIYNAEPTWQSGFLEVGIHVASVILGVAWLIIRIILMLFIMIWNFLTQLTPWAQLPNAEHWPAAFGRGILKLQDVPVLSNSRVMIPLLVILAILYILVSLNMASFRRALARLRVRRASRNIVLDVHNTPAHGPGIANVSKQESWYYRIIDVFTTILNFINRVNRVVVNFVTFRELKTLVVPFFGLGLIYRFWRWMGNPMAILIEPNLTEWGGFMSALRLNLYRAKSFDFVVYASYLIYAIDAYGFRPISIVIASTLAFFAVYLAQARAFMDHHSPEWQRAARLEPRSGIPADESLWTYIAGAALILPFFLLLSGLARRAYAEWLLTSPGRTKAAILAVVMFIPNLVVVGVRFIFYSFGGLPYPTEPPKAVTRGGLEVPRKTHQPIDMSAVKRPIQPHKVPAPIRLPARPESESPASEGHATVFETPAGAVSKAMDSLREAIRKYWRILVSFASLLFILALYFSPGIETLVRTVFGWAASIFASFVSEAVKSIVDGLKNALPTIEEAGRSTPRNTTSGQSQPFEPYSPANPFISTDPFAPVSYAPPANSTSWDVSFLRNIVRWIPGITGLFQTNALRRLRYPESLLGKSILDSLLLAAMANFVLLGSSMKEYFPFGVRGQILPFLLFQVLTSQLVEHLQNSGILGKDFGDKSVYVTAFAFLTFLRAVKAFVHSRSASSSPITRPGKIEYSPGDVTVIIPTKGSYVPDDIAAYGSIEGQEKSSSFLYALGTILANKPAEVILATTGLEAHKKMNAIAARFGTERVRVTSILGPESNLRRQFLRATNAAQTDIICYAHPKVRWEGNFLKNALAPFNDPDVGLVGVPVELKRLYDQEPQQLSFGLKEFSDRHTQTNSNYDLQFITSVTNVFFEILGLINFTFNDHGYRYNLLNYLECLYYQRQNRESASTNRIDGGISLVSAKTALVRTNIVQSTHFRFNFPHEKILGCIPGPGGMRPDAAHFITRKVREMGYKTAFHDTPSTTVRFNFESQSVMAYFRTVTNRHSSTCRSDLATLRSGTCFKYLWTSYTMISNLVNFSFFSDALLASLLWLSGLNSLLLVFGLGVLGYRVYEQYPHLSHHPRDKLLSPFGILFYYVETILKAIGQLSAACPESEPEEPYINVGFKGY